METAVINPSRINFIPPDFPKRAQTPVKPVSTRILDAYFISLTKQIEAGLKPSLSFDMVEEALASGTVSPDVIDDLEDAMFGAIMEETRSSERVSREQVMKSLRRLQ